jgi:hypothetical protein
MILVYPHVVPPGTCIHLEEKPMASNGTPMAIPLPEILTESMLFEPHTTSTLTAPESVPPPRGTIDLLPVLSTNPKVRPGALLLPQGVHSLQREFHSDKRSGLFQPHIKQVSTSFPLFRAERPLDYSRSLVRPWPWPQRTLSTARPPRPP